MGNDLSGAEECDVLPVVSRMRERTGAQWLFASIGSCILQGSGVFFTES